ncbi:MAG: type II toxin-antitoxin system VapC family toxin [Chloroflexi bacterium]|nr:type II toxin-antitoxin system VapC family toxin [Chloroflexota bacterium]
MSSALLDTNVVSEIMRPAPSPRVLAFLTEEPDLWLAAIVIHELEFGLARLPPGSRRDRMRAVMVGFIGMYEDRVLPLRRAEAEQAALLRATARQSGRTLLLADALIAGTAVVNDLAVATRNVADFDYLDVGVINPWEAA